MTREIHASVWLSQVMLNLSSCTLRRLKVFHDRKSSRRQTFKKAAVTGRTQLLVAQIQIIVFRVLMVLAKTMLSMFTTVIACILRTSRTTQAAALGTIKPPNGYHESVVCQEHLIMIA